MEKTMVNDKLSNPRRVSFKFRDLLLQAKNFTPIRSNWTVDSLDNESGSDPLERLFEEIEYNRETAEIGSNFAKAFTVLGVVTICINIMILAILCANRRLIFQQVFYLLIINFAIIDSLKGVCLASHALRFIITPSVVDDRKVLGTKIDQYVFIFFRLFNLATVFNLLMITLNEYVFIKFPLRYHQLIKKKLVLLLVLISWTISVAFTVASSLAKGKDETVFISTNSSFRARNESSLKGIIHYGSKNVRRSDLTSEMDLHTVFMFALTGFCIFSLLVVLICYTIFFEVIRQIQKHDNRLKIDANRRLSEASLTAADLQSLDERKIRRQLMRRYKYVLVIGSVILVYMLYLISYSSIQILQYFNLSRRTAMTSEKMRSMLITRWILVLLCGLHSTIQPTCYFRMREFREIVTRMLIRPCKKGAHRNYDRSDFAPSVTDMQFQTNNGRIAEEPTASSGMIRTPILSKRRNGKEPLGTPRESFIHFENRNSLTSKARCVATMDDDVHNKLSVNV